MNNWNNEFCHWTNAITMILDWIIELLAHHFVALSACRCLWFWIVLMNVWFRMDVWMLDVWMLNVWMLNVWMRCFTPWTYDCSLSPGLLLVLFFCRQTYCLILLYFWYYCSFTYYLLVVYSNLTTTNFIWKIILLWWQIALNNINIYK